MSVFTKWMPMTLLAGVAFVTGCGQSVTQKDVNEERREAARASEEGAEKMQDVRHEVRKEITDIDQDRRDKVAELRTEIQTNPDANAPKLEAQIAETNREADRKIAEARRDAAEERGEVKKDVRAEVQEARDVAATYESQEAQKQYVADRQQELDQYDTKIANLKKNRDNLAGAARDSFDQRMTTLDDKRDKAANALSDLKSANADDWKSYHDEVQRAFAELHQSYEEAARGA